MRASYFWLAQPACIDGIAAIRFSLVSREMRVMQMIRCTTINRPRS